MEATQDTTMMATQEATEESKWIIAVFKEEQEMKLVEFLRDYELLCSKKVMDYKDPNKTEALWDKFCVENKMDKAACKRWFQSHRTMYGKIKHMKSGQGTPHFTEKQKWFKKISGFLNIHIVHHCSSKSAFISQPVYLMLAHQKSQINPQSESLVQWNRFQLELEVD